MSQSVRKVATHTRRLGSCWRWVWGKLRGVGVDKKHWDWVGGEVRSVKSFYCGSVWCGDSSSPYTLTSVVGPLGQVVGGRRRRTHCLDTLFWCPNRVSRAVVVEGPPCVGWHELGKIGSRTGVNCFLGFLRVVRTHRGLNRDTYTSESFNVNVP